MTKKEFDTLKVGDIVIITQHGRNCGKTGTVVDIINRTAYLTPLNCEFEFVNKSSWRLHRRHEGVYGFGYVSIALKPGELYFGFDIELLKSTRTLLGLSMEEVAEKMFVTKGTISRIESGDCNKKATILFYQLFLNELVRTSTKTKKGE